jgi:putative transcriptional regulator
MRFRLEFTLPSGTRSVFYFRLIVSAVLCALLLMVRASEPTSAAESKPLTAILLIARGELQPPDSDFGESVVLVMNNVGPAPVGVIVNKPTEIPVARLFPDLKRLAQLPDKVYFGGPVEFGTVWFLFRAAKEPAHAVQALDGIYLSADRELLLQLLARDKPMDGLRIFLGHSGWAPGQLEAEIAHGAWNLGRAEADVIFNGKTEHPWPPPPRRPASSA